MSEKKGLFSFIRGFNKSTEISAEISKEEENQRQFAMEKDREEQFEPLDPDAGPVTEEIVSFSTARLKEVLELANFDAQVNLVDKTPRKIVLEITSKTEIGRIIGKEGSTLESLQVLVKHFIIRKFAVPVTIILDADGYRKRRGDMIRNKAKKAAQTVLTKGKPVHMETMTASERKTIHMLFQDDADIQTISEGQGSSRHVVIEKRKDANPAL